MKGLKRKFRRGFAGFLSFVLTMTSLNMVSWADVQEAFEKEKATFVMSGEELKESAQAAIDDGGRFYFEDLGLEESGSTTKEYKKLLGTGSVYELSPSYNMAEAAEADGADLRVFVRIKDAYEGYRLTGDEEIIFLYINDSESRIEFRTMIDDNVTEKVIVKGNSTLIETKVPEIVEVPNPDAANQGGNGGTSGGQIPEETSGANDETTAPEETSTAGDETITPEETPSAGDETTAPEKTPTAGDETIAPEETPSTGDETTAPEEIPTAGDETTAPEESPSTGDEIMDPEETPSTGDETTAPDETSSAGDETTAPEETSTAGNETVAPEETPSADKETAAPEETPSTDKETAAPEEVPETENKETSSAGDVPAQPEEKSSDNSVSAAISRNRTQILMTAEGIKAEDDKSDKVESVVTIVETEAPKAEMPEETEAPKAEVPEIADAPEETEAPETDAPESQETDQAELPSETDADQPGTDETVEPEETTAAVESTDSTEVPEEESAEVKAKGTISGKTYDTIAIDEESHARAFVTTLKKIGIEIEQIGFNESIAVNDLVIRVKAAPGVVPEGTTVEAEAVDTDAIQTTLETQAAAQKRLLVDYQAYDIKLYDADGNEIQPKGTVTVSFEGINASEGQFDVYHLNEKSIGFRSITAAIQGKTYYKPEKLKTTENDGTIAFDTTHFSVYALTETIEAEGYHTVRFVDELETEADNKLIALQMVEDGGAAVEPEAPDHEGYVFTGWDKSFETVTEDLTVKAVYKPVGTCEVTVNYLYDDGSVAQVPFEVTVEMGSDFKREIDVPSINGFDAYYNKSKVESGSITLEYANIQESKSVNVIYKGGTVKYTVEHRQQSIDENTYEVFETQDKEGEAGTNSTAEAKKYTGFTAQTVPVIKLIPGSENKVVINYTRNSHMISFNTDGGSYVEPVIYKYGATVNVTEKPVKRGYTFIGWENMPTTMPDEEVVVTAQWKANTKADVQVIYWKQRPDEPEKYNYAASYIAKDCEVGKEVAYATKLPNDFFDTKEDKNSFIINSQKTVKEVTKADGTTVQNVYVDRKEYTISFYLEENVSSGRWPKWDWVKKDNLTITARYGQSIKSIWEDADHSKYMWYTSEGCSKGVGSIDKMESGNRSLYGKDVKTTTIYYKGLKIDSNKDYETLYTGVMPSGWSIDENDIADIEGFTYSKMDKSRNTLYYTRNNYRLEFANVANMDNYKSIQFEKSISGYKPKDPGKNNIPNNLAGVDSDYVFAGWYSSPACEEGTEFDWSQGMPARTLVVYAKWVAPQYTVSFNLNNGTSPAIDPITVTKGESIESQMPTDPEKTGYKFAGWYTDAALVYPFIENTLITKDMTLHAKWVKDGVYDYKIICLDENDTPIKGYESSVESGKIDTTITVEAPKIDGYIALVTAQNVTLDANNKEVIFHYQKLAPWTYTVTYVDESGKPIEGIKTLTASTTRAEVAVLYKTITGYTLSDRSAYKLTLTPDNPNGTFIYKNSFAAYTVNHRLEQEDGKYVTKATEEGKGRIGTSIKVTPNAYDGYECITEGINLTGKITADGKLVINVDYCFKKNILTVHYQYENGEKAADSVIREIRPNTYYEVALPDITGYTPDPKEVSGTMQHEDLVITVTYYARTDLSYQVNYREWDSKDLIEKEGLTNPLTVPNQKFGEEVNVTSINIEGYQLVDDKGEPSNGPITKNITIEADTDKNVAVFYYLPKFSVTGVIDNGTVTNDTQSIVKHRNASEMVFSAADGYMIDKVVVTTGGVAQEQLIDKELTQFRYTAQNVMADVKVEVSTVGRNNSIQINKAISNQSEAKGYNGMFQAGQTIRYNITVTNNGNTTLHEVNVADTISDNAGGTLNVLTGTGYTVQNGIAKLNAPLTPDGSVVIRVEYTVAAEDGGKTIVNTAKVTSKETAPAFDMAQAVIEKKQLSVKKSVRDPKQSYRAGDTITYDVVVKNEGNAPLSQIVVNDQLKGVTPSTQTIPALNPGQSETVTYTYQVKEADLGKDIVNVVTATANDGTTNTDTVTVTSDDVIKQLSVDKTVKNITDARDGKFAPGQEVRYEVKVTNSGNVTLTGIDVTDELPGIILTDAAGSDKNFTLAPGASHTASYKYIVTEADLGGSITNKAVATAEDGTTGFDTETVQTEVKNPHLTTTKTVTNQGTGADGAFQTGDPINYSITVKNDGNIALKEIRLTDILTVDGKENDISADLTAGTFDLAAGAEKTVQYSYTVKASDKQVKNAVIAKADDGTEGGGDVTTEITDNKAYEVSKKLAHVNGQEYQNGEKVKAKDVLTYEITVANTGNTDLKNISLSDAIIVNGISTNLAIKEPEAGNFDLAKGESKKFHAEYTVKATDNTVKNTAVASAEGEDPKEGETGITEVEDNADLTVKKVLSKVNDAVYEGGEVPTGANLTYTITVRNTGNKDLAGIKLTDILTADTKSQSLTLNGYDPAAGFNLAKGAEKSFTAEYNVKANDNSLTNKATAAVEGIVRSDSVEGTTVTAKGDYTVSKKLAKVTGEDGITTSYNEGDKVKAGDKLTYEITVANTGNTDLKNISLSDTIKVDDTTANLAVKESDAGRFDLAEGKSRVFHAEYTVKATDNVIKNAAVAKADGEEPKEGETGNTEVEAKADFTIEKVLSNVNGIVYEGGAVPTGSTLTYTIVVRNTGNTALTGVKLEDLLTADGKSQPLAIAGYNPETGFDLAKGGDMTFTAEYQVKAVDNTITNRATAKAAGITRFDEVKDTTVALTAGYAVEKKLAKINGNVYTEGMKAAVGDKLAYEISVANTGNTALNHISLEDVITVDGIAAPLAVTERDADDFSLAKGASRVFHAEYTVKATDSRIKNAATATVPDHGSEKDETGEIEITEKGDLEVTKTLATVNGIEYKGGNIKVGDTLVYQIAVKNTGNAALTGITLKDNLHVDGEIVGLDIADYSGPFDLQKGAEKLFTAEYTVQATDNKIFNEATATVPGTDPEPGTTPETDVDPNPDYTVNKDLTQVNGVPYEAGMAVKAGDTMTYTIRVANTGNTALAGITLNDKINVDGADSRLDIEGYDGSFSLGKGESRDFTASYQVKVTDNVVFNTVTAETPDSDPKSDATEPVEIEPNAGYSVTKALSLVNGQIYAGGTVNTGDTLTYTIQVTNTGNMTVKDITLNDIAVIDGVQKTIDQIGGYTGPFDLTKGERRSFTVTYKASESDSTIKNTVIADTGNAGSNTAETPEIQVNDRPAYKVMKKATSTPAAEDGKYAIGEKITYEITVTNTGNTAINNVEVRDQMTGAAGSIVILPGNGYELDSEDSTKVVIPVLDKAGKVVINCEYVVLKEDRGSTIINAAVVTSDGTEEKKDDEKTEVQDTFDIYVNHRFADGEANSGVALPADYVVENKETGYSQVITPGAVDGYVALPHSVRVTVDKADITVTFVYNRDEMGTEDPEKPDNIPDRYQAVFTYTADGHGTVNGTKKEVVNKLKDGQPAEDGIAYPKAAGTEAVADSGYRLTNWTSAQGSYAGIQDIRKTGFTDDQEFTAHFMANGDTPYTVEVYYQKDGAYGTAPDVKYDRGGTTDSTVTITPGDVAVAGGYIYDEGQPNVLTGMITGGDNRLVLKLYFKQQFTVTYQTGDRNYFTEQKFSGISYGEKTPVFTNEMKITGSYAFNGWKPDVAETVTGNAVYVAQWRYTGGGSDSGSNGGSGGNPGGNTPYVPGGPGTVTVLPEEVPLANVPTDGSPVDNLILIDDGNVPLAGLPKTGDRMARAGLAALISGILMAAFTVLGSRKREEDK